MAEGKQVGKRSVPKFYSRGPSGKNLAEKYTTEKQVLRRLYDLGGMICNDIDKLETFRRKTRLKIGRQKKEAERLQVLAQEMGYDEVLRQLRDKEIKGLGKIAGVED